MSSKSLTCWLVGALLAVTLGFASAQEVPKHLQLAREVVQNIKPENNSYSFDHDTRTLHVRFPGDLFSSGYSANIDCLGFVTAMLERSNVKLRFSTQKWRDRPGIADWADGVERGESFNRITNINDVRPGDIFGWRFLIKPASMHNANIDGHVTLIDTAPRRIEPQHAPLVPGLIQWEIWVIDSNTGPNSADDTRYIPNTSATQVEEGAIPAKGDRKLHGVGRGRYYIYTDEQGNVKAAAFAFNRARIHFHGDDWNVLLLRPKDQK